MTSFRDDQDTLGGRIALAREAVGMTPATLAKRLGVKTATLANWEHDQSEPRSNRLVMLAGALGVSPSWLLVGFGEGPQGDGIADEVKLAIATLDQVKASHQQTAELIETLEAQLRRLAVSSEELNDPLDEEAATPDLNEYFDEELS